MGYKLLLADDSITIQKVVELVLAGEGFDIKAANNGDEALAAMAEFRPDVVLADIAMPVMNGYQLCERIKKNPDTKDIPVIMLAGAFEPIDEELAQNVGADDYVVKPFESQELISKVNAVLASRVIGPETEAAEPAVVADAAAEEDLWTMEEFGAEAADEEAVMAETLLEEEPLTDETVVEAVEEIEAAEAAEVLSEISPAIEEVITIEPEPMPAHIVPPAPPVNVELPSVEELAGLFRKAVDERVSAALAALDLREAVLSSIAPSISDSAEKVLWEVAPQLVEKLLKEMLQGALASLTKEVEKVIWETVPDLAETMIAREIEKIKSEM